MSQEVIKGNADAITFVIDLLDQFVLPYPTGTSLGSAAAAAAVYARTSMVSGLNQLNSSNGQSVNGLQNATVNSSVINGNGNLNSNINSMSAFTHSKREIGRAHV